MKVGDKIFGVNKQAQITDEGGIIKRVIADDYFYIDHIGGGGIGNRSAEEIILAEDSP